MLGVGEGVVLDLGNAIGQGKRLIRFAYCVLEQGFAVLSVKVAVN